MLSMLNWAARNCRVMNNPASANVSQRDARVLQSVDFYLDVAHELGCGHDFGGLKKTLGVALNDKSQPSGWYLRHESGMGLSWRSWQH